MNDKYGIVVTNYNEVTKSEFDELDKIREFDKFTPNQVKIAIANMYALIKKSETSELSEDEMDLIKSGTLEIQNLTKYTINELKNGRIVKSDIFVQPKQVVWEDTLEKSDNGELIKKGVFLNTELNKKLNRVGDFIYKGKTYKKDSEIEETDEDDMPEDEKKEMEGSDVYKSCVDRIKNGEGSVKNDLIESLTIEFPEFDNTLLKKYVNNVYKSVSKIYKSKADNYFKMASEEISE